MEGLRAEYHGIICLPEGSPWLLCAVWIGRSKGIVSWFLLPLAAREEAHHTAGYPSSGLSPGRSPHHSPSPPVSFLSQTHHIKGNTQEAPQVDTGANPKGVPPTAFWSVVSDATLC